jgi:hypothetical protein
MSQPVEYFAGSNFPLKAVAAHLRRGTIIPWRRGRNGWWFRVAPLVRMEAKQRDPKILARDAAVQKRIESGDWPMYLATSAVGESTTKRLIRGGNYGIWRIDSDGCMWLRRVESWENEDQEGDD